MAAQTEREDKKKEPPLEVIHETHVEWRERWNVTQAMIARVIEDEAQRCRDGHIVNPVPTTIDRLEMFLRQDDRRLQITDDRGQHVLGDLDYVSYNEKEHRYTIRVRVSQYGTIDADIESVVFSDIKYEGQWPL